MRDPIERQDAIDAAKRVLGNREITRTMQTALYILPSAQPEIVRCKDCANWIPGYVTDNDGFIPPKCGKYQQMVGHSSNDYCSFAERRADENNNE